MITLKKILSLLLCGVVAASVPGAASGKFTADAVSVSGSAGNIEENTKNGYKTYIYWVYNKSATLSGDSKTAVYDVWGKYDTAQFDQDDRLAITSPSSQYISSITCILYNSDGSYVKPKIVGFQPGQSANCTMYFQKNGVYTAYAHSTSGGQAKSSIDVVEVADPSDSGDKTAPMINTTVTASANTYVSVNIETDELSSLTVNGKNYAECTGVDVNFTANGSYTITAEDVNGNTAVKNIDITTIDGSQPVTTSPPVTTAKPTTTAPPTTAKPVTTAKPTTTIPPTTAEPVTTAPPSGYGIIQPDLSQLKPGNTITLEYTPGTPQVYWLESSDYDMVQISGNNVTLNKTGTVTITAHCADNVDVKITLTISEGAEDIELGDVDGNHKIDASDASAVLVAYALLSTGHSSGLDARQEAAADVNGDTKIDASDASDILVYYSAVSTGREPSWNKKN